jgi:hypothetical protein
MKIKGLVLLAVMIVVTVLYLVGENFGCSGRSKSDVKSVRDVPVSSAEKK